MDHYFEIEGVGRGVEDPMLEAYTTLGYLAGRTQTVQLGALVTEMTYRHPGLLAKIVATLDVLSGGRAVRAVGEDAADLPADVGPGQRRAVRGPALPARRDPVLAPQPLSRPHPEVLVGGGGERKTLRLVAQYADACNLFAGSTEEIAHKLDVLHRHCADVGRDPAEIRVTMLHGAEDLLHGDVDGFVREMTGYAALGVETVIVRTPPDVGVPEWIATMLAPAVPRLAELG